MRTMEQPRGREPLGTVIPAAVRNHRALTALIGVLVLVVAGVVSIAGLRSGEEAVSSPTPSDVLAEGVVPSAQSAIVLSSAQLTDAARWTALAEAYAVAEQMANPYGLRQGQLTDAARWTALAEAYAVAEQMANPYGLRQGQVVDAARLTALAEALAQSGGLTAGQLADAARLTALAEAMRPELNEGLTAGQLADAARLTALAEAYGLETSD